MNIAIQLILIGVICAAGFTYYTLFWEARFRPKQQRPQSPQIPTQTHKEARDLNDIQPPEMTGEGGY